METAKNSRPEDERWRGARVTQPDPVRGGPGAGMTRRRTTAVAVTLTVFAALLPVTIAIYLAYVTAVGRAESDLREIAASISVNTSILLKRIDGELLELSSSLTLEGSDEDVARLRSAAFEIPQISEARLTLADGRRICSSWGPIDPPKWGPSPPTMPGFRLKEAIGEGERAGQPLLIAARTRLDNSEVSAVILPEILVGPLRVDLGNDGFAALGRTADSRVIASADGLPALKMKLSVDLLDEKTARARASFEDGVERTVVAARLEDFPEFIAVAAAANDWILRDWFRLSVTLGSVGLVASAAP